MIVDRIPPDRAPMGTCRPLGRHFLTTADASPTHAAEAVKRKSAGSARQGHARNAVDKALRTAGRDAEAVLTEQARMSEI
jgi:hypothetical protein